MVAPGEKSLCVLEYHTSKTAVTAQSAFRAKYAEDPPTEEVKNIDAPMLTRVWQLFEYRIDVCHVTRGAHIENL
jgi:hypothetical protein